MFCNEIFATTLQDLYDELSALEKSYKASIEQKELTQAEMNRVKANIANTEQEIKKARKLTFPSFKVESMGVEPTTSTLRTLRSPN